MSAPQGESRSWRCPGGAKAWFRLNLAIVRTPRSPDEIRCLCARARTETDAHARARMIVQFLSLGHLADPALDREVDEAFASLSGRTPALARLPVLDPEQPDGIIRWCRFVLTQPAERAMELCEALHPLMGRHTVETAPAVERALLWALFEKRPAPP
jgi:hypothetical protein